MMIRLKLLIGLILWLGLSGWDFAKHSIPLDQIKNGGPVKDGIPALNRPHFVDRETADQGFMKDSDRVLGLIVRGKKKAYPIKILNWHEIVNDVLGGRNVVVSYCPLCGTGMVFDAEMNREKLTFGVSGLLYQSDMLLYDRQTESLWSQIQREAVTGPMTGRRLRLMPSTHTTWAAWKKQFPETQVLSPLTGHERDYERNPYEGYESKVTLLFDVTFQNSAYHPKEQVVGVEIGNVTKAYPFSELSQMPQPVRDRVGHAQVTVSYDSESKSATVRDGDGKEIPAVTGFWFAWYAFHPDTLIFRAEDKIDP